MRNPAKYDRRIVIQRKEKVGEDGSGYPIMDWIEVTRLWAKRVPLRGREFFAAAAVQAEKTVRYEIRYRKGLTPDMRLIDGKTIINNEEKDRIYEIYAVLDDVWGDRTETHLMTTEELTNG